MTICIIFLNENEQDICICHIHDNILLGTADFSKGDYPRWDRPNPMMPKNS